MHTKHIDTQAQLREAKSELKIQMKEIDRELKENWIFSWINKLLTGKKRNTNVDDATADNLKFLSAQNNKKVDYAKIGKIALSIGMGIAAPIIAKKLMDLKRK